MVVPKHTVCPDCGDELDTSGFTDGFYYGDGTWAGSIEHEDADCVTCGAIGHVLMDLDENRYCVSCKTQLPD